MEPKIHWMWIMAFTEIFMDALARLKKPFVWGFIAVANVVRLGQDRLEKNELIAYI